MIEKLSPPTSVKGIRSFLGHARFYRQFIKDFAMITKPLSSLLEKDVKFEFSEECLKSFNTLKENFISAPIIVALDWNMPFELMYDASDCSWGNFGTMMGQSLTCDLLR